jgi:hypothetical protein
MTGVKWAGVFSSTLTVALLGLANVLLASLTRYSVPNAVNDLGAAVAAVSTMVAFAAYLYDRTTHKLDLIAEMVITRIADLESRISEHNAGFVEGYLISDGRDLGRRGSRGG